MVLEICPTCGQAKKKQNRSEQQNNYYWGVVIELMCETTGNNQDDMHEIMRMMFLKEQKDLVTIDGTINITTSRSTTSLKKKEFEDYLSKIREFASTNLDCYIPTPNEEGIK